MINLPKPSSLRMNGNTKEQLNYIILYLKTLTEALETAINVQKKDPKSDVLVRNISFSDGALSVFFTNGSIKTIILQEDSNGE